MFVRKTTNGRLSIIRNHWLFEIHNQIFGKAAEFYLRFYKTFPKKILSLPFTYRFISKK